MAIIRSKQTRALIEPTAATIVQGIGRTHVVIINNDGTVQTSGALDLGYVGDNKATYINIDTSNLIWNQLPTQNPPLGDVYKPILTFQNGDFKKSLESEDGNVFYVPSEITAHEGRYRISYALVERTTDEETYEGNVGDEDEVEYTEVFISQSFEGYVAPVGFTADEYQEHIDLDPSVLKYSSGPVALQKPEVLLAWDSKTLVPSASTLGYVGDRLITPIGLEKFPTNPSTATVTMFFSNGTRKYKAVFASITTPLKFWLPAEITNPEYNNLQVNYWQIAAKLQVGDIVVYAPFTRMAVINSITPNEAELQEIYTTLYELNNQPLIDEDGNSLNVLDTNGGEPYKLSYTGADVDTVLGWVFDKKQEIEDHISNADIHITTEEKQGIISDLSDLDTRLISVEDTVANFDTNIESKVEEHTASITSLQASVESLAQADESINGRINLAVGRLDVAERNIQTNAETIAGVYSEVNNLNSGVIRLLDEEKAARIAADNILTAKDNQLESAITTSNERIKAVEDDVAQEATDRASADTALGTRISQNTTAIGNVQRDVQNIQNDATIIRNDSNIAQAFVAKIIFLSSEAEYQTLVDEDKIEANTLYLIQEEEE